MLNNDYQGYGGKILFTFLESSVEVFMPCLEVYFVLNFVLKTQIFKKHFIYILGLDLDSQQKMAF